MLAGSLCQPLGWRDKGSISRVPGGGVRRQKWNHGGSGAMEETQLLLVTLRQRMRKRNTLIYPCSPCQGLTSDCHWPHPGRSQPARGPGASKLQAGVSLPEKQDRGRPRNGWETHRPCLAQGICLDHFFFFLPSTTMTSSCPGPDHDKSVASCKRCWDGLWGLPLPQLSPVTAPHLGRSTDPFQGTP